MAVIDKRTKWDKVKAVLRGLPSVDVGIIGRPEIAVYAVVHEFGSADGSTPARRWLTKGIEENGMAVQSAMAAAVTAVLDGKPVKRAAADAGADVADIVRAHVNSANFPPQLKADTVRRKGHAKQMVDSGQMMQAITSRVNGGR